jgi:hypothetical protein
MGRNIFPKREHFSLVQGKKQGTGKKGEGASTAR